MSLSIIFNCALLLCCFNSYEAAYIRDEPAAVDYLRMFGYLEPGMANSSMMISQNTYSNAIKDFQRFVGLDVTGKLDENTKRTMRKPRCGVIDKDYSSDSGSHFKLLNKKWEENRLTYRILNYPRSLKQATVDREVRRAFDSWADVTPLRFFRVDSGNANIKIQFTSIDGPGKVLGQAYSPPIGDITIDDDETWFVDSGTGLLLIRTLAHEIGHALGLDHSNDESALMFPVDHPMKRSLLDRDDIAGIQAHYGGNDSPTDNEGGGNYGVCTKVPQNDNSGVSTVVVSGLPSKHTVVIPGGPGVYTVVVPGGHSGVYTVKIPSIPGSYTIVCPGVSATNLNVQNDGKEPKYYVAVCLDTPPGVYPLEYPDSSRDDVPLAYPVSRVDVVVQGVAINFIYQIRDLNKDVHTVTLQQGMKGIYRFDCPSGQASFTVKYQGGSQNVFTVVCPKVVRLTQNPEGVQTVYLMDVV